MLRRGGKQHHSRPISTSFATSTHQPSRVNPSTTLRCIPLPSQNVSSKRSLSQSLKMDSSTTVKKSQLPPVVFILGGPGSGKGTQCERLLSLAESRKVPELPHKIYHINVGGVLRGAQSEYRRQLQVNQVTENMQKCGPVLEEMLSTGQILPSWVTVTLMKEELQNISRDIEQKKIDLPEYTAGVLIDGFPRSMENLENFENIIDTARRLIVLDCEGEAMIKRVLARGALDGREDDQSVDTIRKRLDVFNSQTAEVISNYARAKNADEALSLADQPRIAITIDGNRPVDDVSKDFIDAYLTLVTKL